MTSRRSDSGLDGILLIDKPSGWTSHDVVAKARRLTGQRRIGHTGTLDPMASGLLVLCLGRATKLVEYLGGHDKRYTGVVTLGRTTTTDDAEGETVAERPVPDFARDDLEAVLDAFRGPIMQRPPAFSALKVQGRRAYAIARGGGTPELAARPVTIHALSGELEANGVVRIDVTCSAGTYVRSLARDIGEQLGCGGHLSALRRELAGPFAIADAVTLEQVESAVGRGDLEELLVAADEGIMPMDAALVAASATPVLANGGTWASPDSEFQKGGPVRIYDASGEFVGVGSVSSSGEIRASKLFLRNKSTES